MTIAPMTGAHALPRRRTARHGLNGAQRLTLFASLLGGAAAAIWIGPLHAAGRPGGIAEIPWWAELIACYAAGLFTVQIRLRRFHTVLSLAEVPLAAGLFLVAPPVLLGCYAGGSLAAQITRRGPHLAKDYSNLMVDALCVGVTVLVFTVVGADTHSALAPRSLLALGAGMVAGGCVVAPLALNLGVYLFQGQVRGADVVRSSLGQAFGAVASSCIGITVLALFSIQPLLLVVLVPPALLMVLGQLAVKESHARADRTEFLFHAGEVLHSTTRIDERAGELLASMTAMFGVSRAELLLVPEGREAAVRFSAAIDSTSATVNTADLTYAEQEMLNALRLDRMVHGGQGRNASTPLGLLLAERLAAFGTAVSLLGKERPLGLLLLLDPLDGDAAPLGEEAELLLSVAGQISAALENGQLAGALRSMTLEREELNRRAFYDSLTQIANRSLFEETVTRSLAKLATTRRPIAVLVIDLDGFSAINEMHGHTTGDQVLSAVAARLRAQIRKFDMVARLNGDEFGILLDGMRQRDDVHIVAQRIVDTLHMPITMSEAGVVVGGSVGVALADDAASAPAVEELLRRADMAMYLAKRQGKDRYVVFDTGARETVIVAQGVAQVRAAAL